MTKKNENADACAKVYDAMAPQYDAIAGSVDYHVPAWLIRNLMPLSGSRPDLLDCACATGNLAGILRGVPLEPATLVGLDISAEMVRRARESGAYSGVQRADLAEGLPDLDEQKFDVVIANGCFEFIADPIPCLRDANGAAKPGAMLLCTFEKSPGPTDEATTQEARGETVRRFQRTRETVTKLLTAAGWKPEEVEANVGYRSPTTGIAVMYWYVRARR